jgi:hypothetical protein
VREQRRQILPKTIREKQRGTVGGQDLRDLVDHALRHRERTIPDVDRQQQFTLGVPRHPHPLGRTLQALDGLGCADLPVLYGTEEGKQLIELDLVDVHIVEKIA